MFTNRWMVFGLSAALMVACGVEDPEPTLPPSQVAAEQATPEVARSSPESSDRWAGRWNGPEGTYLLITWQRDRYTLEIADLDGPRTYDALDVGDYLEFQRNGAVQRIRHTDGKQTGMKWLEGKSNCLTIKPGEGYCRDPE